MRWVASQKQKWLAMTELLSSSPIHSGMQPLFVLLNACSEFPLCRDSGSAGLQTNVSPCAQLWR